MKHSEIKLPIIIFGWIILDCTVMCIIAIIIIASGMSITNKSANDNTTAVVANHPAKAESLGRFKINEEARILPTALDNRVYVITDTKTHAEYMFIDSDDGAAVIKLD